MITEQQIQEYIFDRNESEYENRRIYSAKSDWGRLTLSQKRAKARRHLEREAALEAAVDGKCPKCGSEEMVM